MCVKLKGKDGLIASHPPSHADLGRFLAPPRRERGGPSWSHPRSPLQAPTPALRGTVAGGVVEQRAEGCTVFLGPSASSFSAAPQHPIKSRPNLAPRQN
jgi:hypothetical protein